MSFCAYVVVVVLVSVSCCFVLSLCSPHVFALLFLFLCVLSFFGVRVISTLPNTPFCFFVRVCGFAVCVFVLFVVVAFPMYCFCALFCLSCLLIMFSVFFV